MAEEVFQYVLCPYCGQAQAAASRCVVCGGLFEPLSRRATQINMGPWFIRDKRMPFRPGCSYEALKRQVQAGRVKATTVLRGPTTRQFWSVARNTPGVAHLLGFCHACGATVKPADKSCPKCQAKFEEIAQRNELGLMFPTPAIAAAAQKALDHDIQAQIDPTSVKPRTHPAPVAVGAAETQSIPLSPADTLVAPVAPPGDLLNEVLGAPVRRGPDGRRLPTIITDSGQALDFAPADDQDMPVTLQPRRRFTALTLLLVLSNLLILVLLLAALYYIMNHS